MGTYIHFTDEQKERANSVDLEEFLRRRGEKLLRAGRESRLARVHHITVRGNEWYDHIARRGGHAVSFVQHYYGTELSGCYGAPARKGVGGGISRRAAKAGGAAQALRPAAAPHRYAPCVRLLDEAAAHQPGVISRFARAGLLYEDAQVPQLRLCGHGRAGRPPPRP